MTKQITTESGIVLLLASVPEHSINHYIKFHKFFKKGAQHGYHHLNYRYNENVRYTSGGMCLFYADFGGRKKYPAEGQLRVKHFNEMSEEECKVLVNEVTLGNNTIKSYQDYTKPMPQFFRACDTAIQSLSSLIRSHGFDPENTVVLTLKK